MTLPTERRTDREAASRRHFRRLWNVVFGLLRLIAHHVRNVYATFGLFILGGAAVAVAGTWAFAEFAGHVTSGRTQAFDDTVLRWLGAHRQPALEAAVLEITALGTGTVVMMVVGVAGLFLWLTHHRHSTILLLVATAGGLVLNNLLKVGFDRPRPKIFEWGTHAMMSSFPSGHAMSATIVYSTVAYLAARLMKSYAARALLLTVTALLIVLICGSRLYLGVHYPSDVLAGAIIGLAWAAFCMATLEAAQMYARRSAPEMMRAEREE